MLATLGAFLVQGHAKKPSNPFSWDLSYASVFDSPAVIKSDSVARFFRDADSGRLANKHMQLPAELFHDIEISKVKTAILIDYRAFWFKGHRVALFYVRTSDSAYVDLYESSGGKPRRRVLELPRFDKLDRKLKGVKPEFPMFEHKFKFPPYFIYSGYVGVLSQYRNGTSTQMLLTAEDILKGDMKPGRVTRDVNKAMGIP